MPCLTPGCREVDILKRARLTYEQRQWLEEAFHKGYSNQEIFDQLGIDSYQLYIEKRLGGWSKENPVYSADIAQMSLQ